MGILGGAARRFPGSGWVAALAGVAAVLAAAPALAQDRWEMATPYSDSNFHTQNIRWFADELRRTTGGRLDITVHSGGSTYKMPEIRRAVENGQVALGELQLLAYGADDPLLEADGIPFLAVGPEAVRRLYQAQRPLLDQHFQSTNARLLFSVPWPPIGMISTVRLTRPQELANLKLRATIPLIQRLAELLGATPTQVQQADVPQAFGNGTLTAAFISPLTAVDGKDWEFARYYYDFQIYQPRNAVIINDRVFRRLPQDLQAAVQDTAARAEARGWDASRRVGQEALKTLARNGIEVVPPGPAFTDRFGEIGRTMTDEWLKRAGADGDAVLHPPPAAAPPATTPP